ncbi:MAG: polysaccharide biosynthesis C-terminal domain-containing protein [Gammaproteobacteria bacterium]|nr:polysaccharide biosynthesis C-terminal domain-containing protein [Gammaproteobacteria bacterium]
MNPLKRLASQTAVYGISSIVGRFLNYLLVPLFTYYFTPAEYGVVSEFYAYAGFFSVLLLFGFETGYFRFRDKDGAARDVAYSTALRFLLGMNLTFFLLLWFASSGIAGALQHGSHPEYVAWIATILALDATGAVAFAKLRAQEKALRFAAVKIFEIIVNVGLCLFLIVYCRGVHEQTPDTFFGALWDPAVGVGYIFIANLIASGVKLLLLAPQLRGITQGFDRALFGKMLRYSLPMVIIGFDGIVNEMLDRAVMKYLLPGTPQENLAQLGIYSACYKLSILMSLFIQAFRYAGEPFFFAHAKDKNAPQTYADVLRYFVIFCAFIFLLVTLYLDIFKYFVGEAFRAGLHIVPILLLANLFLGIYVNLSIWYKLTDRTLMGALVSTAGAIITVTLLLWWVPLLGYAGAAWATLVCYSSMTLLSYLLGRKYYPVPYDVKRVLGYVVFAVVLYVANQELIWHTGMHVLLSGTLFLLVYVSTAYALDVRKLRRV